ncbi:MAG: iron ABC transporter permease [Hyphomicrobiaceae bacterium]|nr:iron ABC transporter permease [Hyphomicrobiaceae bacterium]
MRRSRAPRLVLQLGSLLLALMVLSLLIGPTGVGLPSQAAGLILAEIRLPRTLLAAMVGGALGLSGAALQGYLRNPLAEPGVIGISGGAGLGAVIAIHSGAAAAFSLALPLGGLAGALGATLIVLGLAGGPGGALTLILAGVAVSSVTSALISGVLAVSRNPFASVEIVYWLLGSLADRSLTHVWLSAPFILAGSALMLRVGPSLDALALGEDVAANLGIAHERLRRSVVAGSALAVGAATAVAGTIGFVGLVVPHLLRPLAGHQPSRLLLPSALGGAALVLSADIGLRLVTPAGELRLGVVTALVGTPFFLWLVVRTRRELHP